MKCPRLYIMQDVINRYSVARVIDAGMLHPSVAYALWRRTLSARNLAYTQVRQGATVTLGSQVSFQVLWPPAQLHKGSDETRDNALVLRLLAPGLRLLLLNSTTLSAYALKILPQSVAPVYLQAQIAQVSSEAGKAFSPELTQILNLASPSLLLITAIPVRKSKITAPTPAPPVGPWQVVETGPNSPLEISADGLGRSVNAAG